MNAYLLVSVLGLVLLLLSKRRSVYVFAYGSLIWDHIPYRSTYRWTTLRHFKRSLCFWSYSGRGTPESPGLYYGIVSQKNECCRGKLLQFYDERVLLWLDRREGDMYIRKCVRIDDVQAFVYISNVNHPNYDPDVSDEQIERAMRSRGNDGSMREYVYNTNRALRWSEDF